MTSLSAPAQPSPLSQQTEEELVARALSVRKNSYSPYSQFQVGAALLCSSGTIVVGTNVENVSFGLSICAEVSALCQAIALGERSFRAIAIAGGDAATGLPPCGRCRQALAEFSEDGALWVIMANHEGKARGVRLAELLPHAFNEDLKLK